METNLIYCGDNLEVLAKFPEKSVDLIYADPPFFSNKVYEIIWGNGAEMRAYEDRWKGGINVYIEWMKERLWQCHRVLKDTGSMYLHCDWHASHRLRIAMDDIFDERNFQNEIIWHYHTGGVSKHMWGKKHDTIFFYAKGSSWIYNLIKEKRYYDKAFFGATEGYQKEADGRLYIMAHPDDVWDIPAVLNLSKERLGYPTQKPEALVKRIIEASSDKDNIILDPFCGCGTTLVVANQLGRKWIGIDVSPIACNLMKERLNKIGVNDICIIGAPKTVDELKALPPFQFQNWIIDRIGGTSSPKKSSDMGIDGYAFLTREPIQIKQSENIGRNVVDNFETAIRRAHKTTGYIIAFSFAKSAHEESARAKAEDKIDIKLVRVDELDRYFLP